MSISIATDAKTVGERPGSAKRTGFIEAKLGKLSFVVSFRNLYLFSISIYMY